MKNSDDFQPDLSGISFDEVGGGPLAGSGFETQELEPGFSAAESEGEEQRPWRL